MLPGAVVLSKVGIPILSDFNNATGAPIVGNTDTGQLYWMTHGNVFPVPGYSINVMGVGATGDGVTDDSAAFQLAFDTVIAQGGGWIFIPAGRYIINSRLKLQNTYANNVFVKITGVGSGNEAVAATSTYGSILVAQTGGICIDMAGGSNITLEDFGIISGPTNPSTIGILGQRITTSPYFANNKFVRMAIGITPNAAANGGLGTFAFVNKRGEHHHHYDCWYYADRPFLFDGSSVYPTLISPDYAEFVFGGATLSLNYLDNCAYLAASGNCVELRSTFDMNFDGGYMLLQNGAAGMLLGTFNDGISLMDVNAELGTGTPLCLVRAISNATDVKIRATTNISGLTLLRTVSGASVAGYEIDAVSGFSAIFDKTTESGSTIQAGVIKYNSGSQTVPDGNSIYASVIMDKAGGVGAMDLRALNTPTVFNTGNLQPPTTTTGTDTTPVVTETYIAEVFVPASAFLTGMVELQGTVGAGNVKLGLANQSGVVVAQTNSFSVAGVTAAFVGNNFTSSYYAKGPGKYFALMQCDSTTNRFRSHTLGVFGASKKTGETFGTFTTITPPTSFTTGLGPIVSTY